MSFTELLIHWATLRFRTLKDRIFGPHPGDAMFVSLLHSPDSSKQIAPRER
jgi:hypothetical protein